MADFTIPTFEEQRGLYLRALANRHPATRTGPATLARAEAGAAALVVTGAHEHLRAIDADVTPATASEQGLGLWALLCDVPRKPATGARKAQALLVSGTESAVVPSGALLEYQGMTFATTSSAAIVAGLALLDVAGVSTGPSTRIEAGAALRFVAPPAGIETTARLVKTLDEDGEDEEPIGDWRERVKAIWAERRRGGNIRDYEQWALELNGNAEAYVYGAKPGRGSVSVAALHRATREARALTAPERAALAAYLAELRPVTDQVFVLETLVVRVHGTVDLEVFSSYPWDWDDSAGYTVASYDLASRELEITGTWPNIGPGALLTVASADPDASGATGRPAIVAAVLSPSVVSLAPIDVGEPLDFLPVAGDTVHASSATALAAWRAALEGYRICGDTRGGRLQPGLLALGPANPSGRYGAWLADVRRDRIESAASSVTGVLSATATIDGELSGVRESIEFAFPDTTLVELLVPGQWIVRQA
jgi:uncharacterized phage protein gp47/JayE